MVHRVFTLLIGVIWFCVSGAAYAANGDLKVTSYPEGAEVFADGSSTGKFTPMSVSLPEGEHEIMVKPGSGWAIDSRTVMITPGKNDLSVTLIPQVTDGEDGTSCSVTQDARSATVNCTDGTTASVHDGADGATGPQGPIGLTGSQGLAGKDGAPGSDGETGPQGPIGLTGSQNLAGQQCDPGEVLVGFDAEGALFCQNITTILPPDVDVCDDPTVITPWVYEIIPTPEAAIVGEPVTFTIVVDNPNALLYELSTEFIEAPPLSTAQLMPNFGSTPTFIPDKAGLYAIKTTVTDERGCSEVTDEGVVIFP